MKLFDDLKAIDECLTRVEMIECPDGLYFLHLWGVHHPHLLKKRLGELGYRFVSYHSCECRDKERAANMPAQVAFTKRRKTVRLKYSSKRRPQGARLPVSKTPDSV